MGRLSLADLAADPLQQFRTWWEAAQKADLEEPTAMTLATAADDGTPSARVVLLKGFDETGFTFFTNYESRKARDLEANPRAALLFWWPPLGRQVRIEGKVEKTSAEESDAYFATRPRGSQLGAHASPQSRPLKGQGELLSKVARVTARYVGREVPRPEGWGGYRLSPARWEFWQQGRFRLHDRFEYLPATPTGWERRRLAP
ncbi:MAG: pyridoxamine 5'-phosphate oxidase [Thermoanaerobaculia bacterium]